MKTKPKGDHNEHEANDGRVAALEIETRDRREEEKQGETTMKEGNENVTKSDPDEARRQMLTRSFARRIVEAKERLGAKNAKEWRESFERRESQ